MRQCLKGQIAPVRPLLTLHMKRYTILAFFQDFFGGESIVMQISFVMLIFLLFSDQISGRKSLRGKTASGGPLPPLVDERQYREAMGNINSVTKYIFRFVLAYLCMYSMSLMYVSVEV